MGRGSSKSGGGGSTNNTTQSNVPINPTAMTDAEADQLRQQEDSMYDPNTTAALKMYISNTDFDGDQHSMSQTMNFLLDNGVDLTNTDVNTINRRFGLNLTSGDLASMNYTNEYMNAATHAIGKDVILQRGAHDDLLRNTFGISDYSQLSQSQLQQRLVGQAFRTDSWMSTSYDVTKNPFLSSSSGTSGGREIVFNIKAGKSTKMLFGAKKQSEIVLARGTDFKITGVNYTGNTAYPRNGGARPQIVIDIETF